MLPQLLPIAVTVASLALSASAHPHVEPGSLEYVKRALFQMKARSSLAQCQEQLSKRGGVYERSKKRREEFANMARRSLSLGQCTLVVQPLRNTHSKSYARYQCSFQARP
jgi:hypothetical protein